MILKTKVVGVKGRLSSRTTSGPGRENTIILSAVLATGLKELSLIVFKGKNLWDFRLSNEAGEAEWRQMYFIT